VSDETKEDRGGGRLPAGARQAQLAELIARSGFVSVAEIAVRLGVSGMTIRRDLGALESRGVLMRTHGGAVAAARRREVFDADEPGFEQRQPRHAAAKARIAAAAAKLIGSDETIALDVGTSVAALAEILATRADLRFFTNSLPAAITLGASRSAVYLVGGRMRWPELSIVGPAAVEQVRHYYFDRAFIGVSGAIEGGFYDYSLEDTEVKRAFIERARQVVVLCDSSKFDHRAMARICVLGQCHVLVTESAPPAHLDRAFRSSGLEILVAGQM
jgi:DeoR/GlpR family transcriptional regulator of sugar metabolism